MSERGDPLADIIGFQATSDTFRPIVESLPYEDWETVSSVWVRRVTGVVDESDFFYALGKLNQARQCGIATPPYVAAIESSSSGGSDFVLYAGNVAGTSFDEIESTDARALTMYEELGFRLLNYYFECHIEGESFLSDISPAYQYVLPINSRCSEVPLLVDLDLLHGQGRVGDEIDVFEHHFIGKLEQKFDVRLEALRRAREVIRRFVGSYPPLTDEDY